MIRRRTTILLTVLLCGFSCAYADVPTNNPLDQVLSQFRNSAASWDGALRSASERLFWLLAGISFVAQVIPIAIRGTNIADALEYLVVKTITIGFFYALFVNSATWAEAIVDSLRELGNTAVSSFSAWLLFVESLVRFFLPASIPLERTKNDTFQRINLS